MKPCPRCNHKVQQDQAECPECGVVFAQWDAAHSSSMTGGDLKSPRQVNWIKVAAVLTSKRLFLVNCIVGMVLGITAPIGVESGVHGDRARALDKRMSVVAIVPNADKPGERRVVEISLENLEQFKQDNPSYSFILPVGRGEVHSFDSPTEYTVTTAEPGKVMVETEFQYNDNHVLGRYEATDKEITPLYTKTRNDLVNFFIGILFIGLPLAYVFALFGYFLKWRLRRMEGAAARQ